MLCYCCAILGVAREGGTTPYLSTIGEAASHRCVIPLQERFASCYSTAPRPGPVEWLASTDMLVACQSTPQCEKGVDYTEMVFKQARCNQSLWPCGAWIDDAPADPYTCQLLLDLPRLLLPCCRAAIVILRKVTLAKLVRTLTGYPRSSVHIH